MGYHLENIAAGRFVDSSGVSHEMVEIKLGGNVLWPRGIVTYIVDNFAFAYNIGQMLYVNQGNYAVITARQRKYIDGVLDETTTVTMTPVRISGTNRYTIASDGKVWFDIDSYGTTEFSQSTAQFKGTYSIGGQTYETGSYILTLEGNSKETIIESASISLALRSSTVACTATSADVKPTFSATYHYHYTSGRDSATTTGAIGSVSLYRDGTYIKDTTTSGSFTDIGISTNYNTESMKSYAISAVYQNGGVVLDSDSVTQYQSGDEKGTITDTPISGSYFISKGAQQGTIDATGGTNVRIPLSAGHRAHRTQYWVHGGGTIIDREIDVTDSVSDNYTISGTTDAKSRYYDISLSSNIFHISHYNMAQRDESADDITVTFYNGSDSSATTSASFQPRNTYYPAHYGNTVGITIGLNHDYLECTGGTVEVSGTRQREWYEDSWASGAGGGMTYKYESITSWTSITVSPSATVSGTIITIGERKHNTSSQVFTVTGKADEKTATATVERLGDSTYTGTQYTRNHYLRVESAGNTISAQGGSRKYDISAGHTLVTPTYWRSDDELYSEVTEQITDKWKYSKSGDGQSHYKNFNVTAGVESSAACLSFDHGNMAKREETDTINISIVSAFDSTKTFTETLAPKNELEVDTTTEHFSLVATDRTEVSSARTTRVVNYESYRETYKKWTSLAEETNTTPVTTQISSEYGIVPEEVSGSGSFNWIISENPDLVSRSVSVIMKEGSTQKASETLTQRARVANNVVVYADKAIESTSRNIRFRYTSDTHTGNLILTNIVVELEDFNPTTGQATTTTYNVEQIVITAPNTFVNSTVLFPWMLIGHTYKSKIKSATVVTTGVDNVTYPITTIANQSNS